MPPATAQAHLAGVHTHLPRSEGDRGSPLNEQLGHLEVATGEGIVQGSDALTALASRVVHCSPVVQQEADNVCGPGDMNQLPDRSGTCPPHASTPGPGLTQMPIVAGLMQRCPTTVVPRVQGVAL